jgi:hypothetical protein
MADAVYVSLMAELDFITRLVDSANTVEGHVAAARAAGKVRSLFASDAYNKITISFPQYLSAYVVGEPGRRAIHALLAPHACIMPMCW